MAACLSASKAFHWSSGTTNSGNIWRYVVWSMANCAKKFLSSWYTPPNQLAYVASLIPETFRMRSR